MAEIKEVYIVRSQSLKHSGQVFAKGEQFSPREEITEKQVNALIARGAISLREEAKPAEEVKDPELVEDGLDGLSYAELKDLANLRELKVAGNVAKDVLVSAIREDMEKKGE